MMVLRAVRDVHSNSYHARWIGIGGPTAWPPRSPDFSPLDFYLWGHFIALWMSVRLSTTTSASLHGRGGLCRGAH
jgi:hypothetical protein